MTAAATCGGVVVKGGAVLRETFGLPPSTPFILFRAEDARGLRFATSVRWVGRVGDFMMGAALVDGRIVASIAVDPEDGGAASPAKPGAGGSEAGLLVHAADRNESLLLLGVEVVEIGRFATLSDPTSSGAGAAMVGAETVPIADVARLFDELERFTFELRRSNRPAGEDRRPEGGEKSS